MPDLCILGVVETVSSLGGCYSLCTSSQVSVEHSTNFGLRQKLLIFLWQL